MNLKYAFNIPFKIALKNIIIGTSPQFYDGVQLNILPTLSSELDPKEAFVKVWSSLLSNNGIQLILLD